MKKLCVLALPLILLAGCAGMPGEDIGKTIKGPQNISKTSTTGFVTHNTSMYTHSLECLGNLITTSGQAGQRGITMSVGIMQDKTGKDIDSSPLTQATSEMTLTALTRVGAIDLVGTTDTRDFLQYNLSGRDPQQLATQISLGSMGSVIQSDAFITGAITEYNKDIRNRSTGWDIFRIFGVGGSSEDSVINVAADLRLVNSRTGRVLRSDNGNGKLLAISLQNNVVNRGYDGSFLRSAGKFYGDAHFNMRIADPQHLAIREIIERGVLMLVGELYDMDWQSCDKAEPPPQMPSPTATKDGAEVAPHMASSTGLGDF